MFKNSGRYGNTLTIILIVVIVLIIGLLGWFAYDIYKKNGKIDDALTAVDEFNKNIKKKVSNKTGTDETLSVGNIVTGNGVSGTTKTYLAGYEVKGIIKIPKTKVEYPILAEVGKKSLETAVAILYGPGLNEIGNTVILGHNYKNGTFFSNNDKLVNGDEILITDQSGTTVTYEIYKMYETDPNDSDYMLRDTNGKREISLSTCTDDASARLIIWAAEK